MIDNHTKSVCESTNVLDWCLYCFPRYSDNNKVPPRKLNFSFGRLVKLGRYYPRLCSGPLRRQEKGYRFDRINIFLTFCKVLLSNCANVFSMLIQNAHLRFFEITPPFIIVKSHCEVLYYRNVTWAPWQLKSPAWRLFVHQLVNMRERASKLRISVALLESRVTMQEIPLTNGQ